jgi:hypothetical protein
VWATAYDASGNQMSAGASITVGTIPPPPTLTVPAPITKEATSARGAVVKFSATAWDSNGAPLAVTCKPASGSTFPLGTTKVSCSAVDSYGSRTTKTFTIEVVDTTPPVVTVPSALAADATGPKGAWISYTAAAADTVSGTLVPSCKPASGDTYPIGDTTVSCAATDAAGNTGSASFVVHVRGAHEQLENTRTWLAAQGVDQALAAKLDGELADVEKQIDDDKSNAACGGLADLATDASKQAGKKLTADQAGRLTADAARVGAVIGC